MHCGSAAPTGNNIFSPLGEKLSCRSQVTDFSQGYGLVIKHRNFAIRVVVSIMVRREFLAHQVNRLKLEIRMIGYVGRWGHNVLLVALAALTVAIVVAAK
jgi:hypothetical protein